MKREKLDTIIKFSKTHLETIQIALEVYQRIRIGQIGKALNLALDGFSLKKESEIDKLVLPLTHRDNSIAYMIEQTITQYLAVKNSNGEWSCSKQFDDVYNVTKTPLPKIVNFKKYIDYPIDDQYTSTLNSFNLEKNYLGMWEIADKTLMPCLIVYKLETGKDLIFPDGRKIVKKHGKKPHWAIRIYKPTKEIHQALLANNKN
jgi:hypothetical protein